ncbi:hypothetical protein F2Q68_00035383 [Brassica cretica]|uniref:Uncharacterized protein n=2 Tax=Brassica cretica TaxID=69181 RepID=A0A8S9H1Y9_BRACR|nr:hypothetical protein F2Q68_00035383 [Brassica cretica]KAF3485151.1 hypothetical protein F2Q69_00054708 [Brassica cretica]KAF3591053.1 hypothetical protein DY000_02023772 [Brassica cretica]
MESEVMTALAKRAQPLTRSTVMAVSKPFKGTPGEIELDYDPRARGCLFFDNYINISKHNNLMVSFGLDRFG